MKLNENFYSESGAGINSGFDFRFIIIVALILFSVLKNVGCATSSQNNNAGFINPSASNLVVSKKTPLKLDLSDLVQMENGESSVIINVNGGTEPFVFFAEPKNNSQLSFIDQRSAKITFYGNKEPGDNSYLYVLDGNGDIAFSGLRQ